MNRAISVCVVALILCSGVIYGQESTDDLTDDLLSGFDDEETPSLDPIADEGTNRGWLNNFSGSLGSDFSFNYDQEKPESDQPDHRGLTKWRIFFQLTYDAKYGQDTRIFVDTKIFQDLVTLFKDRDRYPKEYLNEHEQEAEIREAFLSTAILDDLDFKIGRQIKAWGKADTLSALDVLNPVDNREFGLVDVEDARLPVLMAQLDYYWGDWNLNAVLIPEIRFNKDPVFGSDFFPSDTRLPKEEIPTQPEYGLALNGHFSGWDWSLYAADLFNDNAHLERRSDQTLRRKHSRLQILGTAFSWVQGEWLLRGEWADVQGLRFSELKQFFSRQDTVISAEYVGILDVTITFEVLWQHISNYDDQLRASPNSQEPDTFQTVILYSHDFLNQTLTLNAVSLQTGRYGEEGGVQRVGLDYDVIDGLNVGGGILRYQSGDSEFFQRIHDNDRVFADVKYSF